MLLSAKVKMHGMQDERWLIKDKISQYRGIISLYERDRKLFKCDLVQSKKRYSRDIRKLRSDIHVKRHELGSAAYGDKQFIRNVLQDHRRLQLAYMNSHADRILENLNQNNFNQRKLLDRIRYSKQQKFKTFRQLQLEAAEVRDRIIYKGKQKLPVELKEQTVSNHVQCANIRKNAALALKYLYLQILEILKKDSRFFTVVLEALKADCVAQDKCLLGATEMGQLAIEYLDDRKYEYSRLENEIKINMKERKRTLKYVRKEVGSLTDCLTSLTAKDATETLDDLYDASEGSSHSVHWELDEVLATCKGLARDVKVSTYYDILPRLKDQRYQTFRLMNQLSCNSPIRDSNIEDYKMAHLMLDNLKNFGQEDTFRYITEKKSLRANTEAEEREAAMLTQSLNQKGDLIICMRNGLQHIVNLLSCVGATHTRAPPPRRRTDIPAAVQYVLQDTLQPVPEVEQNFDKLITTTKQKINLLMAAVGRVDVTPDLVYTSRNFYQGILQKLMSDDYKDEVVVEGALMEFETSDPNVPDYHTIKLRSKQLVEAQVGEFDEPTS